MKIQTGSRSVVANFDPNQPREADGKFADTGGGEVRSKGHIGFFSDPDGGRHELYSDKEGNLWRAPTSSVIDVDTGNRIGRWEAPPHLAESFKRRILGETKDELTDDQKAAKANWERQATKMSLPALKRSLESKKKFMSKNPSTTEKLATSVVEAELAKRLKAKEK